MKDESALKLSCNEGKPFQAVNCFVYFPLKQKNFALAYLFSCSPHSCSALFSCMSSTEEYIRHIPVFAKRQKLNQHSTRR